MKNIIKGFVAILLFLLAVTLVVQNLDQLSTTLTLRVDLKLWSPYETSPMAFYLVIIIVFLLGLLVGLLLVIVERFKLKKKIKTLTRENREKDKELSSYRNLPIVEDKIEERGLTQRDQDNA